MFRIMKQLILLWGILMTYGFFVESSTIDLAAEWESFKLAYSKTYSGKELESLRNNTFAENRRYIDNFNAHPDGSSFTLAINHLADMSNAEINLLNGLQAHKRGSTMRNSLRAEQFIKSILERDVPIPDELDWRKVPGRVGGVRNQGDICGSDWAFAATGVLEGQQLLHMPNATKDIIPLSAQNLLDCVRENVGCLGGIVEDALYYARVGIESEQSYPYEAVTDKCRFNVSKSVMSDTGYWTFNYENDNEDKLKELVAKFGPVAVGIEASDTMFHFYKHGVYYNEYCASGNGIDHAVLVVGYGTDPSHAMDYWLVKNSWGPNWGEEGYVRMARNRNNNCGIATLPIIPTF